jgi:hypothetical protein
MKKRVLVKQLRKHQRKLGHAPRHVIDFLPDNLIIEAYITCSDCNGRLIDDQQLAQLIGLAKDCDHFLSLLNQHTCSDDEQEEGEVDDEKMGPAIFAVADSLLKQRMLSKVNHDPSPCPEYVTELVELVNSNPFGPWAVVSDDLSSTEGFDYLHDALDALDPSDGFVCRMRLDAKQLWLELPEGFVAFPFFYEDEGEPSERKVG